MVTKSKLIFDTMELSRGLQISDDTELDERYVGYLWDTERALWIRQEYNKPGRIIDHNLVQDLGCIDLEVADTADCCEVASGCSILRTIATIPQAIELYDGPAITRVATIDKLSVPISFVSYDQAIFSGNGKYNRNTIFAFLLNNRIYLKTNSKLARLLDRINIRGVFEDPEEASRFVDCDNKPCYTIDSKYPLNAWMIPIVKERILQRLTTTLQIPKDNANDAQENIGK